MADLTDFQVTDDVTDNLATYHNRLLGGIFRAEFANTETLSATKELADGDCQLQIITASGDNRTVELAPEADTNHLTLVYNATPSSDAYNVTVKDDSGSTTYTTLSPAQYAMFVPVANQWIMTASNSMVSFTPSWSGLTIGSGTVNAMYSVANGWVDVVISVVFNSTTITSAVNITNLPVSIHSSHVTNSPVGTAVFIDTGINYYFGAVYRIDATTAILRAQNAGGSYLSASNLSSTVPFTWGDTDIITVVMRYRAA